MLKIKNKVQNRILSITKADKLGTNLEEFHLLSFNEFNNEIMKKWKIRLSLKDQDEWEEYFEERKKEILELEDELKQLDKKIDMLVYDLYGLNNKEIKLVENSLN